VGIGIDWNSWWCVKDNLPVCEVDGFVLITALRGSAFMSLSCAGLRGFGFMVRSR
jgi:hypothetical protein